MKPVAVLAVAGAALAAGVVSATAAGDKPQAPKPPIRPTRVVAPVPIAPCRADKPPAAKPPSQRLLGAFAILRRERTPEDALPREALAVLRARGLAPVDAESARLLRTTGEGGKAWVVPVANVHSFGPFGLPCRVVGRPPARPVRPARPLPAPPARALPSPVPAVPLVPALPPRPVPTTPQEGLAVVALDGAPAGGGGPRDDLIRGRGEVTVDACAGPERDMLAVSGVVPDGVGAAYLTSRDGTAVRADVRDNGYAFVVPRSRRIEQRYVVWTGGDGTPHVQPVPLLAFPARCRSALVQAPRVSPGPFLSVALRPALPVPRRP